MTNLCKLNLNEWYVELVKINETSELSELILVDKYYSKVNVINIRSINIILKHCLP